MRQAGLERIKPTGPSSRWDSVPAGSGTAPRSFATPSREGRRPPSPTPSCAASGCFGFCAAEPLAMAYRPGQARAPLHRGEGFPRGRHDRGPSDDAAFEKLAKSASAKIEAWDFRTSVGRVRRGLPLPPRLERAPLLQGPGKAGAAGLGPHRPREHRGVPRRGGLLGPRQGPRRR